MDSINKTSPLANISLAREVIAAFNLQAKKSFGQNFLINDAIVKKTIELADVQKGDFVTEIGPGYGTLTVALVRSGANVLAVEKDPKMINALVSCLERFCPEGMEHIKVLRQDALKIDFDSYKKELGSSPVKLISNLPYNVAAPIIITYFQKLENIQEATVMVQKEIADRILASPGNKNYGSYTVKLAMYVEAKGKFGVSPNNFMPPPRVESTVIKLIRHNKYKKSIADKACLIADAAFAHRRKTISNSVKDFFNTDSLMSNKILNAFTEAEVSLLDRAETLKVDDYVRVANCL